MRPACVVGLITASVAASACGGGGSRSSAPYALDASAGTYNDGSGRVGFAILATLRDARGSGPAATWSGTLSDGNGALAAVTYDASGAGSYAGLWLPEVAPAPGSYGLALAAASGEGTRTSLVLPDGAPLTVPQLALSADAATLSWPAVVGAVAYECRVSSRGVLQRATLGRGTTCDVGTLPAGAYQATVLAYSADLSAIGASTVQHPPLPARFDVSEAHLAFSIPTPGAPAFRAAAAGGALEGAGGTPGLAVWVSLAQSDGTVTPVPWTIEIVGPGLPSSNPLTVAYGANIPRLLFWSYDVVATPGVYSFTATSPAGALAGSFTVGTPEGLSIPQGVSASGGVNGSASVSFTAVPEALSYLVSVYDHTTGALAASAWVSDPAASFPQGSFVPGSTYDVYVDATNADMLGGAVPTQVAVSENTYQPAILVAP